MGNIPFGASETELRELLAHCGPIASFRFDFYIKYSFLDFPLKKKPNNFVDSHFAHIEIQKV